MQRDSIQHLVLSLLVVVVVGLTAPGALADHQTGSVSLSVTKAGQGTITGGGISCGADCSEGYTLDEECVFVGIGGGGNHNAGRVQCDTIYPNVNLSASGTNGYVLDHWTGGNCSGSGALCHPLVNDTPTVVTAHFRDTQSPVLNFSGPAAGSEIGGTAYAFSASPTDNDEVASVEYRIDGQPFATSSAPPYQVTLDTRRRPDSSPISNGSTVSITAIARDRTGLVDSVTRSYVVDNAVSARFTTVPDDFTNALFPQVGFASDDGDITGYACTTLRNGTTVAGPGSCASPYSPLVAQEGTYEVRVQPTDDQGNTATLSDTFVVDRTNPVVAVTTPVEGAVLGGGFTPAFSITDANHNPSQTKCRVDSGQFGTCGAVATPTPDGDHTLTVRAVDRAGNVGEDSNPFVVDTTAPQLDITNGPAQNEIIATSSAAFTFSATDAHGPIDYSCGLDHGALGGCSGGESHDLTNLPDGPHTFIVRADDAVGNARTIERQFTVNAVRPTVEIVAGLPDGAVTASDAVVFRFAAAGGEVTCSLDSDGAFRACSSGDSDALTGLADGQHTFRVRVRDESNDQLVAARSFRVDRSRPETSIDAGPAEGSLTKGDAVTFAFSSPGSTFQCRFGKRGAVGTFGPCSGPSNTHAVRRLAPGRYQFEVYAVNALGLADLTPARRTFRLTRSFEIRVANVWQVRGARTALLDLTVRQVPRHGRVKVSCKGRGCAFKKKTAKVSHGVARLVKLFKKRTLSHGAVVEIRVSAPGAIARIVRFTMRRGKFPKRRDACLLPGASRPGAC
jgi:large repetitive protein